MNYIYITTPIDQTEGLEEKYYRCISHPFDNAVFALFQKGEWLCNNSDPSTFTHYLRPIPEGSVVVNEKDLEYIIRNSFIAGSNYYDTGGRSRSSSLEKTVNYFIKYIETKSTKQE